MPASAKWSRDELILVLDLYFEMDYASDASDGDERIASLARTLSALPLRDDDDGTSERTARDVSLILGDYLRFDPEHAVMRARISENAERVWEAFAGDRDRLQQTAESIRRNADMVPMRGSDLEDEIEFDEGRILTRIHFARERNALWSSTIRTVVAITGHYGLRTLSVFRQPSPEQRETGRRHDPDSSSRRAPFRCAYRALSRCAPATSWRRTATE